MAVCNAARKDCHAYGTTISTNMQAQVLASVYLVLVMHIFIVLKFLFH